MCSSFYVFLHSLAQNPPEFLPGVSQDVTRYFVVVDMMDSMSIPAGIACPTSTCSITYSLQSSNLPNSPLSVSVSAENIIGVGQMCTPQTEIGMPIESYSYQYCVYMYYKTLKVMLILCDIPGQVPCTVVSQRGATMDCLPIS